VNGGITTTSTIRLRAIGYDIHMSKTAFVVTMVAFAALYIISDCLAKLLHKNPPGFIGNMVFAGLGLLVGYDIGARHVLKNSA
jgi:hypothetical protein